MCLSFHNKLVRFSSCLILFAFAPFVPLTAQVSTASLNGVVTDVQAAAVPGAAITVINTGTGQQRSTATDTSGHYVLEDLASGSYKIEVKASSFKTALLNNIVLQVGTPRTLDFNLTPGEIAETVTVQGSNSTIATSSPELATVVDQQQVRAIPLNGRNFEQLIQLAPGVQPVASAGQNAFIGRNNTYSISGSRNEGQAILLDGADIQGYWQHGSGAGTVGTSLGVEAIDQFQTLVGVYGAQFGGNGSAINAVTRSGTNSFHGSLYNYLRNDVFDARNYFDVPSLAKPVFRRNQFGGTLGGPIIKDKLLFFVNYEGLRQMLNETQGAVVPDANAHAGYLPCSVSPGTTCLTSGAHAGFTYVGVSSAIQPLFNLLPIPTQSSGGLGQIYTVGRQPANEDYVNARVDYTLTPKTSLFARYVYDYANLTDPYATSPVPGFSQLSHNGNQYLTLEARRIASDRLIYLTRFNYVRLTGTATSPLNTPALNFYTGDVEGLVQIPGGSQVGVGVVGNDIQNQSKYTLAEELYYTRGRHSIRAGASAVFVQTKSLLDFQAGGFYAFSGLAQFLQASPFIFEGPVVDSSGNPERNGTRNFREYDFLLYAQDDWRVSNRLTLNVGLRYVPETNPTSPDNNLQAIIAPPSGTGTFTAVPAAFATNPELKNIDPRLGLSWDVRGDHRSVVHAAFGIFHEPYTARSYGPAYNLSSPYNLGTQIYIPGTPLPPIVYGHPFQGLPNGGAGQPSISNALPYQTNVTPYMMQASLGVEHEILPNTVLNVSYVHSTGVHLMVQRNLNPPVRSVTSTGASTFASSQNTLNRNYSTLGYVVPGATSNYNALQAYVRHNLSHGFQTQLNYTWSRCMDDASSAFAAESFNGTFDQTDPYNVHVDYGRCAFDIRSTFSGNAIYQLPFKGNRLIEGWSMSGVVFANTGQSFSVYDSYDQANLGDTQGYSRPNRVGDPTRGGTVAANPTCVAPAKVQTINAWYNPCAFQLQAPGTLGNERRDTNNGPKFTDVDLSFVKDTKLTEKFNAQFRVEGFNIFNHPNFGLPNLVGFADPTGVPNAAAGQINSTVSTSRQIQFALKLRF
jgi:hypothetical protein